MTSRTRTSTKCLQIRNVIGKKFLARTKEASIVSCNVALPQCYCCVRDAFKKKNFIWKEKFLSGGGGGKKKGPNFPSKRAKKVGN